MTAGTGTGNRQMIKIRIGPVGRCMAIIASVGRSDMCGRLARGGAAVMATGASAGNCCVIYRSTRPAVGGVAGVALSGCG